MARSPENCRLKFLVVQHALTAGQRLYSPPLSRLKRRPTMATGARPPARPSAKTDQEDNLIRNTVGPDSPFASRPMFSGDIADFKVPCFHLPSLPLRIISERSLPAFA